MARPRNRDRVHKELASVVEVSACEPDRLFALKMVDGTRMLFTAHGQPSGPMRLLQPVPRRASSVSSGNTARR